MRVLVVEDEVLIGEHLCSQLHDVGYEASGPLIDGAEAVEYCRSERPDIVLMDIRLGGEIDGITAAQIISGDLQIPVVYLTAYSDEETLDRAKATHPFGYLLKPCSESHLRVTLEIAHSSYLVERGIRDSEARYRVAVEGLRDGVWVVDERGRIVFANDALEQLLGCPPGNLTGLLLEELLAAPSRPVFRERFDRGRDGDAFELTMRYHPDDELDAKSVTVAVSMRAVGERAGHPHGFCGVCVDISRLKQDQDRLSEAEQTFSQVFQAIPDASIVVKLCDRTLLEVNGAFLELTGYTRDEIVGNNMMMLANWEDLDDLNSFLALFDVDSGKTVASALRCRDRGVLQVRCLVRDIDSVEEKYRLLVIGSVES